LRREAGGGVEAGGWEGKFPSRATRKRSAGWGLFGLPNPYFYRLKMGLRVGPLNFFEGSRV
jgi:hypothetical protein